MNAATAAIRYFPAKERLRIAMLLRGDWMTWKECVAIAGVRAGARLHELRGDGWQIETKDIDHGKAYKIVGFGDQPRESLVRVEMPRAEAERLSESLFVERGVRDAARKAIKKHRGAR